MSFAWTGEALDFGKILLRGDRPLAYTKLDEIINWLLLNAAGLSGWRFITRCLKYLSMRVCLNVDSGKASESIRAVWVASEELRSSQADKPLEGDSRPKIRTVRTLKRYRNGLPQAWWRLVIVSIKCNNASKCIYIHSSTSTYKPREVVRNSCLLPFHYGTSPCHLIFRVTLGVRVNQCVSMAICKEEGMWIWHAASWGYTVPLVARRISGSPSARFVQEVVEVRKEDKELERREFLIVPLSANQRGRNPAMDVSGGLVPPFE